MFCCRAKALFGFGAWGISALKSGVSQVRGFGARL